MGLRCVIARHCRVEFGPRGICEAAIGPSSCIRQASDMKVSIEHAEFPGLIKWRCLALHGIGWNCPAWGRGVQADAT
jgi:hypothetical protein